MKRVRTLAMLDDAIASATGPAAVPALPLEIGGVDPLGLRQLNFNMMDRCIPGLNNAAWRLRPYVVMAWGWWQAGRLAERDGLRNFPVQLARRFADRIEVLFQAGHLANGHYDSLPGSEGIQQQVIARGGYDFSSTEWDVWHRKRQQQGALMAPVSYGPSSKEGLGLGFLRAAGGMFVPVEDIMPAVRALDGQLTPVLDREAFTSLTCGWVPLAEMIDCYPLWRLDELAADEIDVGRKALWGTGGAAARGETIDLLHEILENLSEPADAPTLRLLAARSDQPWSDRPRSRLWRALQTRQLLRISLEGLLNWVLARTGAATGLMQLGDELLKALDVGNATTLDAWLTTASPTEDGLNGAVSPVSLLNDIEDGDQAGDAGLCASGLRAAIAICREMDEADELFGGQADRLPLKRLSERLRSAADLPMRDACQLIVSELLIGQQVYWAVGRSGDDTQRLRIVLDEGGWVALQGAGQANPTPDRLASLLELAADCGLVARAPEGGYRPASATQAEGSSA